MTEDFQRPIDRVNAALPGTVGEIALSTGYPVGKVLSLLTQSRAEGQPIRATEDGITRSIPPKAPTDPDARASTIFSVDSRSTKE